jgi:hypothetical protein
MKIKFVEQPPPDVAELIAAAQLPHEDKAKTNPETVTVTKPVPAPPPRDPFAVKKPTKEQAYRDAVSAAAEPVAPPTGQMITDGERINQSFVAESSPNHIRETIMLPFSATSIDHRVQRYENKAEVNAIARDFNADALQVPTVSIRVDPETNEETYVVLDGQQRRAAALQVGFEAPIAWSAHRNLSLKDEARLFRQLNFRRSVTAGDLFRVSLAEENVTNLHVMALLKDLGIELNTPRGLNAVRVASRIAERPAGLRDLRWALEEIKAIFDKLGLGGVYDGRVVEAFALLHRHRPTVDSARLRKMLAKAGWNVPDMIGEGRTTQRVRGGKISVCIADAVIKEYNRHLPNDSKTLLDEFPRRKSGITEEKE